MSKPNYRIKDYSDSKRPHLKAVVRWKNTEGKWERKFFTSKGEAKTFAQQRETELQNQGREALDFPSWLRVMAQECNAELAAQGKTLRDATTFYLAHLAQQQASRTFSEAFEEYFEGRVVKGISIDYRNQLRSLFGRLIEALGNPLVSEVTLEGCEKWLRAGNYAPCTYNGYMKNLSAFFGWCLKRRYCATNPIELAEEMREVETEVGILTPEQLEALLKAADPQMLAYIAIGAFAGLRKAEMQRLDWSEIDLDEGFIEVRAKKSKTARRRLVKIQPCLDAWLRPVAKKSGRIIAHKDAWPMLVELRERAGIKEWPNNALRHSFASYHLAKFKNAAELALEMGHTGTGMIFAHYRQVVREADAARYWAILPEQPENVLQMAIANTPTPRALELTTRDPITKKFVPNPSAQNYQRTAEEYAEIYGVTRQCVSKWIRQGRPLDDREAMEKLWKGEYEHDARYYAKLYNVSAVRAAHWIMSGWPLDDEKAMRQYLTHDAAVKASRRNKEGSSSKIIDMPETTPAEAAPVVTFSHAG